MKLQQSISKRAKQQWVGRELVLLAEGESEETPLLWEGRTQFHAPRSTARSTSTTSALPNALEPGRFYRAEITEAHDYDGILRSLHERLPLEQAALRPPRAVTYS
jgi:ribosomal protein S12 methylthiotransferase